jgi:hypothetical protein
MQTTLGVNSSRHIPFLRMYAWSFSLEQLQKNSIPHYKKGTLMNKLFILLTIGSIGLSLQASEGTTATTPATAKPGESAATQTETAKNAATTETPASADASKTALTAPEATASEAGKSAAAGSEVTTAPKADETSATTPAAATSTQAEMKTATPAKAASSTYGVEKAGTPAQSETTQPAAPYSLWDKIKSWFSSFGKSADTTETSQTTTTETQK